MHLKYIFFLKCIVFNLMTYILMLIRNFFINPGFYRSGWTYPNLAWCQNEFIHLLNCSHWPSSKIQFRISRLLKKNQFFKSLVSSCGILILNQFFYTSKIFPFQFECQINESKLFLMRDDHQTRECSIRFV